ncbi:MAG: hypoxanthine phosphoribosyltransferase [Chloroflexota bacterium]|nr:hypoxanthine phosphoribosyltransferase [Dehalococcoidia bacterium]MDW8252821.1 hypoxanthine phosphoribosyltransferase [Chloroflexota bacterium]
MARAELGETILTEEAIQRRVRELGAAITRDYAGREVVLVGVLKGAAMFLVDLARAIELPVTMDFMAISSYGPSTETSGIVRILKDLDESIEGKDVLVVEDIVDSGLTLRYILDYLQARSPASLRVCALLDKQAPRRADVALDYTGFLIPNRFVVGYGLDYAENYRNLPFVAELRLVSDDGGMPEPL